MHMKNDCKAGKPTFEACLASKDKVTATWLPGYAVKKKFLVLDIHKVTAIMTKNY